MGSRALSVWGEWWRGGETINFRLGTRDSEGPPGRGGCSVAQGEEGTADPATLRWAGEGQGSVQRALEPEAGLASWACHPSSCAEPHIQKMSHTSD